VSTLRRAIGTALGVSVLLIFTVSLPAQTPTRQFSVSFPASAHAEPITGRVFVFISHDSTPEPRLYGHPFGRGTPLYGMDVDALKPGETAVIGDTVLGFPFSSLKDLPAGDYYVQALINVYTEVHRADGHTLWVHWDQWEGQQFNTSPGNLYSGITKVHLDPMAGYDVALSLTSVIPPVQMPPDTKWVKHIRIQSDLLTKFWGHPVTLGAVVLLPRGYDTHPDVHYPVIYEQGHFGLQPPMGFTEDTTPWPKQMRDVMKGYNLETGPEVHRAWTGPNFPRFIAVTFQHPTPYFDDSYAINSANNGPYGDAIMTELIPYLESHFRIIAKPYARVLTGGSTGGWESIALQIHHPDFFGGTWTLYPDPVDFRHYDMVNAYADTNAFVYTSSGGFFLEPSTEWRHPERYIMRAADGQPLYTEREYSQWESVLGSHGRSADQLEAWEAVYGPVGDDGYPKPLWDKRTGHIDHDVALYMRDHGYDLRYYLAQNWAKIGPQLVGKIHVDVGDMDNFYLNLAVYDLQAFLDTVSTPSARAVIHYGRPEKGHGWQHATRAELMREMAAEITRNAPKGENTRAWKY
jgi:S-formylglutathione hydrolase FrmB